MRPVAAGDQVARGAPRQLGVQRLLTFEVPGGGFSWFGQAPANKILTSYGLMEFADMAKAFGGYGERVTDPGQIKAAIQRGIEQTKAGKPALLEFITAKETRVSKF